MDKLTTRELESLLGVTAMTIYRWRHQEGMPYHKRGKAVYFDREEVFKWIEEKGKRVLLIRN